MANRRMLARSIVETDPFRSMPLTTQCLYFHLNVEADDDGFVSNAKTMCRAIGCNEDDLKLLVAKMYLLLFESGVYVITDWHVHNQIQNDRYNMTEYVNELKQLTIINKKYYYLNSIPEQLECKKNAYDLTIEKRAKSKSRKNKKNVYKLETSWIQNGSKMETQDSKEQASTEQESKEEFSKDKDNQEKPEDAIYDRNFLSTILDVSLDSYKDNYEISEFVSSINKYASIDECRDLFLDCLDDFDGDIKSIFVSLDTSERTKVFMIYIKAKFNIGEQEHVKDAKKYLKGTLLNKKEELLDGKFY